MTTLYLVRHGETTDNAAQIMQGLRQGQLNERGIKQITQLAHKLEVLHFDAIISSDLKRAIDSATIIASHLGMQLSTTTPLLRERDWGDFTGRYIPDLQGLPFPDNTEKLDTLLARASNFIHWLSNTYPEMTVLAVGHGIINKAIQAVHYGKAMKDIEKMTNAEYRIISIEP